MRFLPTLVKGVIDWALGAALLLLSAFSFPAKNLVLATGALVLAMAILTDYEPGLIRKIPIRTHLRVDVFWGLFLVASPWLFDFRPFENAHFYIGIFLIALSLCSKTQAKGSA